VNRAGPRFRAAVATIAPLLSGAVATAGCVLLVGWPNRPPLPDPAGVVAASALVVVAILLVFAPTVRPRRPEAGRNRSTSVRAHTDRAHRAAGHFLGPVHAGTRVHREFVERPGQRKAFEPAR
jgi:hypothetical protein